jgi:hypothetical protein
VNTKFENYRLGLVTECPDHKATALLKGGLWVQQGAIYCNTGAAILLGKGLHCPFSATIPAGSTIIVTSFRIQPLISAPNSKNTGGVLSNEGTLNLDGGFVDGGMVSNKGLMIMKGGLVDLKNEKQRVLEPLFNGKDLSGWKQFTEEPKRAKSKFTVTSEGWLSLIDGPGDLQTEKQFDDFILQAECISNGKHLNSGIFFRCLPGQYQNGYEAQIQNGYKDGDRAKPTDYGTGAIYRRQPARKVVSNDNEWFTMTIAAHGNHIATWVNGYQVTDFTDTRPPNENARNGSKTGKGAISIQGHDPTTNLSFRNIRIVELPKK